MTRGGGRTQSTVVGLAAARDRLLAAHRALVAQGADLGPLTGVLAVATEIDGMLRSLGEELRHAKSTAAGLGGKVAGLERQLRSAEDELGRLRPEAVVLREKARHTDTVRAVDRAVVAAAAVTAVETALAREGEYLRLAHRELVVEAVLAVVDGMAWAA